MEDLAIIDREWCDFVVYTVAMVRLSLTRCWLIWTTGTL